MTEHIPLLRAGDIGGRQVLRIGLWWSRDQLALGFEALNAGFEKARDNFTQASDRYPETVKVYDAVTHDEGRELYEQSLKRSASPGEPSCWYYRISGILGRDGHRTGWAVPLLLVHFRHIAVPYAAPNEARRERGGSRERSLRTTLHVLRMFSRREQEQRFGRQLSLVSERG